MKKKKQGYIKICHGFLDHPLYVGEQAFNLKEVYLDLNLRAFYQDTTKVYKNRVRTYQRGQVEGSTRQFAEWWNMSRDTVQKRLKALQEIGLIYVESTKVQTVITLRNYCTEQDSFGIGTDTESTTDSTTESTTRYATGQATDQSNLKKDKEVIKNSEKNQKNKPSADLDFLKGEKQYE